MKPYNLKLVVHDGEGVKVHTFQLDDPFVHGSLTIGWNFWDALKMLCRRKREVRIAYHLSGNTRSAISRVMNVLHEDCVSCGTGDMNSHDDHVEETSNASGQASST
jgi:hypothetical protein